MQMLREDTPPSRWEDIGYPNFYESIATTFHISNHHTHVLK